jgi:serine/threonine protein kinase
MILDKLLEQVKLYKKGSFGRVKIAQCKSTKKYHAIKILKKAEIIKLKQVDHIMNEVKILSAIDHPFLVKFYLIRLKPKDLHKMTNISI